MKRNILKQLNRLIAFSLSILGIGATFTACDNGGAVEYGVPNANYKINGKVTSETTSEAIKNIRVSSEYDTAYTNENGEFEIIQSEFPLDTVTIQLKFSDVDGTGNGEFKEKDTAVVFIDPEYKDGEGSWYKGTASKEFNISLEEEN
ncbi:MAG: radical SAM-associated putative lipoprotein [Bacteroidales bacterium]|nr:radical SAM-associated putative lipoprotein [Bacteroidales bacterium]MBN2818927.1 radical SAM-associated putative lipoprotein [Bacteroidales bacterium]